jgi:beta-galactosidase
VELRLNGEPIGRVRATDQFLFTFPDVAWKQGTLQAVGYVGGKPVANQKKRTAGPPVALRLTAMTAPGGLRADGSDVVLVDVEAVDAEGERCPTFQNRVDFELAGPGVWRGGYNSGKAGSTIRNRPCRARLLRYGRSWPT